MMLENTWREKLKSGPLTGVYACLRRVKRKLLREPLAGVVPIPLGPWGVEAHFGLLKQRPDDARLYFSLAIAYFERNEPGDLPKARACLRSASALDFESPERTALYDALIAARTGCACGAIGFVQQVPAYEWTEEEAALVRSLSSHPHDACQTAVSVACNGPEKEVAGASSVLVVGDGAAASCDWVPSARYMLVSPEVTGVDLDDLAPLGRTFEVGVRPVNGANGNGHAEPSPLCGRWVAVDFDTLGAQ